MVISELTNLQPYMKTSTGDLTVMEMDTFTSWMLNMTLPELQNGADVTQKLAHMTAEYILINFGRFWKLLQANSKFVIRSVS